MEQQLTGSLKDIVKIRKNFVNLLIMVFMWTAVSTNAYLISLVSKSLPGNFFINNLTSSTTETLLSFVAGFFYAVMGVRAVLNTFFAASTLGGVLIITIGNRYPDYVPIMMIFANGGVKIARDVNYNANASIFPAIFSGTAIGFCAAVAKAVTIISPMLA